MMKYLLMGTMLSSMLALNGCGGDAEGATGFAVSSNSIVNGGVIAEKYSGDGGNVSPHVQWKNAPEGTKSFVLIMDDPDAKPVVGFTWVHWNVFLKDDAVTELDEGASGTANMPAGAIEGTTSGGAFQYIGPNPPKDQTHTYHICVYAMSTAGIPVGVTVNSSFTRTAFKAKFDADILKSACMTGKYTGK